MTTQNKIKWVGSLRATIARATWRTSCAPEVVSASSTKLHEGRVKAPARELERRAGCGTTLAGGGASSLPARRPPAATVVSVKEELSERSVSLPFDETIE